MGKQMVVGVVTFVAASLFLGMGIANAEMSISAAPTSGLNSADTTEVTITGGAADTDYSAFSCPASEVGSGFTCDPASGTTIETDATGVGSSSVQVRRSFNAGGGDHDCAVEGCRILIFLAVNRIVGPDISFAPVLYEQGDSGSGSYNGSNDFAEPIVSDEQTADDFVVPSGVSWSIAYVNVEGLFTGSPPATVRVRVYPDDAGKPGATPVLEEDAGVADGSGPDYRLTLSGSPPLAPGRYWVVVQQVGATIATAAWRWETRGPVAGYPAMYIRAGESGVCGPGWVLPGPCLGTTQPDQVFELLGAATPLPPGGGSTPALPSTAATGLRVAALKKCKKKKSKKARKKCKKKASKLPV